MSVDDYKNLWDGSEPGWVLEYTDHTVWSIVFLFGENGPSQSEIIRLHKLIPELQDKSLAEVCRILKNQASYRTQEEYGNIEASRIKDNALDLGLNLEMEARQAGGCLPVFKDNTALIIEDEELLKAVAEKMIESGIEVIDINID